MGSTGTATTAHEMWGPEKTMPARRSTRRPPRITVDVLLTLAAVGFGICLALVMTTESWSAVHAAGGWWLLVTRLSGMAGGYGLAILVVLIARLPWLERVAGQDQLVRWHRSLAPTTYWLVALHIAASLLAYGAMQGASVWTQLVDFIRHYPDMLSALVGFGLLTMAAATSVRQARRALKYETWWTVHLYTYLGLAFAFFHQIRTGVMFVGHPLATLGWEGFWAGVALLVLGVRLGVPLLRNAQWQLRVESVSSDAPGVVVLKVKGRGLDRMHVDGGQFFQWRFLAPGLWWHAHPYSLSALPRPPYIRCTVKGLGDHSRALASLRPGTRVFVEGPYGAFTRHASRTNHVVLIGAGVGTTPLRSLLEDLPPTTHVTVILRGTSTEDIVHRDEMRAFVEGRSGSYFELIGSRHDTPLTAAALEAMAPTIQSSDIFLCGPEGFMTDTRTQLSQLRVPHANIHFESFAF